MLDEPNPRLDRAAGRPGRAALVASLYAEIYACPEADAPRDVLADALCEAGDPRGEFIQLQMARSRGTSNPESLAREQELVATGCPDWVGIPRLQPETAEFSRGFPVRARVGRGWRLGEMLARPASATILGLDVTGTGEQDFSALLRVAELYTRCQPLTAHLPPNLRLLHAEEAGPFHDLPAGIEVVSWHRANEPATLPPTVRRVRSCAGFASDQIRQLPDSVQEVEYGQAFVAGHWRTHGWGLVAQRGAAGFDSGRLTWTGPPDQDRRWSGRAWVGSLPRWLKRLKVPRSLDDAVWMVGDLRRDIELEVVDE